MKRPAAGHSRCLLVVSIFLGLFSCRSGNSPETRSFPAPIPTWAVDPIVDHLPDGREQLRFSSREPYPSARARAFYGAWATANGWELVPATEEAWSSDAWDSFQELSGGQTTSWCTHWRSSDRSTSLRLVLLYERVSSDTQMVYVVASPYYLLDEVVLPAE